MFPKWVGRLQAIAVVVMILLYIASIMLRDGLYAAVGVCVAITSGEIFVVWHALGVANFVRDTDPVHGKRRALGTYGALIFAVLFFTGVQYWFLMPYLPDWLVPDWRPPGWQCPS